ncbi:unnamed protein product [Danaus chrysippus]|uniref:(African queen) hypothetical protein n=1 Tax=Danaus chrysippus TaxID=151541 RepID=A0A8J2W3S3_9NEOP|nr:unnamed protein product [Danaus chrysippus]
MKINSQSEWFSRFGKSHIGVNCCSEEACLFQIRQIGNEDIGLQGRSKLPRVPIGLLSILSRAEKRQFHHCCDNASPSKEDENPDDKG